jgi:hypothetical protein
MVHVKVPDVHITAAPVPTEPTPPPAEPPVDPTVWTPGLILLAGLVGLFTFLLGSPRPTNSDIWQTLAVGRLLAEGKYQFGVDPFSWASEGVYWANPSWLGSLIAYEAYVHLGPMSLNLGRALLTALLAFVMVSTRTRQTSLLLALELTALALLAATHRSGLQTTVFSFLGIAVLVWLLLRNGFLVDRAADEPASRGIFWQLPLLFLVWSNLDGYYVMGLVVLVLALVALLVRDATRPDGIRLGIATVLAVVACMLNPHFHENMTMPLELSYILGFGDAGETARKFEDRAFFDLISPLSGDYMQRPIHGWNFAGISFYILALLNLGSVALSVILSSQRTWFVRAAICVGLGVLAMTQARLIPFYAIAAGPLTAINVATLFEKRGPALTTPSRRSASITLAGIALLLGIFLAWPGWLHLGFNEFREERLFQAARRVSWELTPDPSLKEAALALGQWHNTGTVGNVLNIQPLIAHYCAFFAPQARCGIDQRAALYAKIAGDYGSARTALLREANAAVGQLKKGQVPIDRREWAPVLRSWNVDHVAFTSLHSAYQPGASPLMPIVGYLMLDARQWWPRYADGRAVVLRWSPDRSWTGLERLRQWDEEAFAPKPESSWLPDDRPIEPPSEPSWWEQYAFGAGPIPLAAQTAFFQQDYFKRVVDFWQIPMSRAWVVGELLPAAGLACGGTGAVLGVHAAGCSTGLLDRLSQVRGQEPSWFHSVDFGPAALPTLMQRNLRQALIENREHPFVHLLQADMLKVPSQEELWWARHQELTPRVQVRTVQTMAALYDAMTLSPDRVVLHEERFDRLIQFHCLDAALVELEAILRIYSGLTPTNPSEVKALAAAKDHFERIAKQLRPDVDKRRRDYELKAATVPNLEKTRLANSPFRPYRFTAADNRERQDPRGRGLVLEAIRILAALDPTALPPHERFERNGELAKSYLLLGRIDDAAGVLKGAGDDAQALQFANLHVQLWAATGGYKRLDLALESIDVGLSESLQGETKRLCKEIAFGLGMMAHLDQTPPETRMAWRVLLQLRLFDHSRSWFGPQTSRSDYRTLRGIFLLERGDTASALRVFEQALEGDIPFADRPIAARYRDLLRARAAK